MLNSTEHEISTVHMAKILRNKIHFLAFKLSKVVFIMQINVKMPRIVVILTFMNMINFILSCVVHEKSFIVSGLDLFIYSRS